MFCFCVCLGEEHARSKLRTHHDESQCLDWHLFLFLRDAEQSACVLVPVPPLLRYSFSPHVYRFDLWDPQYKHGVVSALILQARLCLSNIRFIVCGKPCWA